MIREYNCGASRRAYAVKYRGRKRGREGGLLDQRVSVAAGGECETPERTRGAALNNT